MLSYTSPQKAFKVKQWPARYDSNWTAFSLLMHFGLWEDIMAMCIEGCSFSNVAFFPEFPAKHTTENWNNLFNIPWGQRKDMQLAPGLAADVAAAGRRELPLLFCAQWQHVQLAAPHTFMHAPGSLTPMSCLQYFTNTAQVANFIHAKIFLLHAEICDPSIFIS